MRWKIASALVLLMIAAIMLFLFRSVRVDNPELGIVTYKYHWGKRKVILADSNRDGRIDVRALLRESGESVWEDRDYDGVFEVHFESSGGKVHLIEIDQDHDGTYDFRREGASALQYWEEHFTPPPWN